MNICAKRLSEIQPVAWPHSVEHQRGVCTEPWDWEIQGCPPQLSHGLSAWPWASPFTSLCFSSCMLSDAGSSLGALLVWEWEVFAQSYRGDLLGWGTELPAETHTQACLRHWKSYIGYLYTAAVHSETLPRSHSVPVSIPTKTKVIPTSPTTETTSILLIGLLFI